jgi:hypothetical protein
VTKKIALVSCTKKKQSYSCEAQEMYSPSNLFSKIKKFIQSDGFDDWYTLSAKYGLLKKDTVISPYDVTLLKMRAAERKSWAEKIFEELQNKIPSDSTIYFFAGEKYRQYLCPKLESAGISYHIPLKGMQIGEQLSYLNSLLTM